MIRPVGNPHRSRKGFTLLEVMVAVLLFALTVTGVAAALTYGVTLVQTARDTTLAQAALQAELADIRLRAQTEALREGSTPFRTSEEVFEALDATGTVTVNLFPSDPGVVECNLVVYWTDRYNQQSQLDLATLVMRNPGGGR